MMRFRDLGPATTAAAVRELVADPRAVEGEVRAIVDAVRREGDAALVRFAEQFDGASLAADRLLVTEAEIAAAAQEVPDEVVAGLATALENVTTAARSQIAPDAAIELPEGQRIAYSGAPVGRVGAYVPAGRAAYPSSLIMVCATARAAGVEEVAVCAASRRDGTVDPLILAACELCGVSEVYRVGGAQAIAALAYGTEAVRPVDVIAGPGNSWVQEAKRQVVGTVGIDGIAGPSELVVVADPGQAPEPLALDLMAQAEHGPDSLVVLISPAAEMLESVRQTIEELLPARPSVTDATLVLVRADDVEGAAWLADEIAPEHVQLVGPQAESLAATIGRAGCLFVGVEAATAFGDYVAGSNHVLPTGGAARFQSALSVATFRRRMARVSLSADAAGRLAAKGAPLARAEGFPVHAESMERRA